MWGNWSTETQSGFPVFAQLIMIEPGFSMACSLNHVLFSYPHATQAPAILASLALLHYIFFFLSLTYVC